MSQNSDHLEAEIARADQRITRTRERVSAHLGGAPITGRASSPNGAVTVAVRPGGAIVELNIQGAALSMRPDQLADEIVAVAQRATRNAGVRMHQSLRPVVSREVTDSLTELGVAPAAPPDEDVDWVNVIRGHRGQR